MASSPEATAYATTTTADPSHRPRSKSARRSGRASSASATPDSRSPPTAGAPTNAAVIASTKLNMNAIRIRTCETPIRISSSSTPSARASSTNRDRPNATSRTDTIVRTDEDPDDAPPDELLHRESRDDDHASVAPVIELEEARLERTATRLDRMDTTTGGHDGRHEIRDSRAIERPDREPVVVDRHGTEGLDGGPSPLVEVGHAEPNAVDRDDIVERPRGDHPAAVEDDHAVADPLDLGQQVRVEDHRGAAIARRADDGADVRSPDRIERRGRLIEQDQLRLAEQRDAQPEALLHALGEAADRVPGTIREPDPVERLVDRGTAPSGGQVPELGVQRRATSRA